MDKQLSSVCICRVSICAQMRASNGRSQWCTRTGRDWDPALSPHQEGAVWAKQNHVEVVPLSNWGSREWNTIFFEDIQSPLRERFLFFLYADITCTCSEVLACLTTHFLFSSTHLPVSTPRCIQSSFPSFRSAPHQILPNLSQGLIFPSQAPTYSFLTHHSLLTALTVNTREWCELIINSASCFITLTLSTPSQKGLCSPGHPSQLTDWVAYHPEAAAFALAAYFYMPILLC